MRLLDGRVFDTATIRIHQQLTKQPGHMSDGSRRDPEWEPTKSGRERTVTIAAETVELLRAHRRRQSELKMANRTIYHDFGLVFAKEWGDAFTRKSLLGEPLQGNNIGERAFLRLIKEADVKVISFHGMRHTCATLLLMAGEAIHVVSQRLGHSDVSITWNTYSHVLPNQQKQAAARLAALLHG